MSTRQLTTRLLETPADKMLVARCYDMGEQRMRESCDFQIVQKSESGNGVVLQLENKTFGLLIRLRLAPTGGNGCRVTVEPGWIVEYKSISYRLMELSVFPEFLRTKTGDRGAYLLPMGSGFLADFRVRPHQISRTRVYMDQSEWEKFSLMNCFGCMTPGRNILCVIEEGDFFCFTEAEFNRGGWNDMRVVFQIRKKPGDMLRFEPLALWIRFCGARAGYDDLAKVYRAWFMERKGVALLRERAAENPVLAYSLEALRVKIFMAQKKPYVPDGSSPVKVHTTCEDTIRILSAMKKSGIRKAVVTLVGWNLGGHDGAYPSHFPIEPSIGGEPGLRKLIEFAKGIGYQIVPHDNWTDIYRNSADFDYEYVARTEDQEPLAAGVWGGGQAYKACPLVQLRRFGYEFEKIRNLGFEGHYYMDAQSTVMLSCHSPHHPADEKAFALGLSSLALIPRAMYGAVAVESCSAYTVPFVDESATLSFGRELRTPCEQALDLHPIPFFHIALHGLIQYQVSSIHRENWKQIGLLELALGGKPFMEVSRFAEGGNGGDYRTCLKRMAEPYRICFDQLKHPGLLMDRFKEPVPNVYFVSYDNGLSLGVNLSGADFDGLKAGSWKKL